MRSWGASSAALLGLCFGLAASIGPAEADKVGVAAAVNPDAFSSLAGAPQSQLNIGKSIFFNERINTTTSGVVQVLLVDGSTFTVGPGSDLVIDKFVYDPKKGTGQIAASFSKGVMRFVGGKISKNEGGVTVNTPAGALAIRGGMVQGTPTRMSFLFGVSMTWKGNNGQTATVYEPGYTLDLTGGTPNVKPTTAADTNSLMAALTNSNTGGTGGTPSGGSKPSTLATILATQSLNQLISDATTEQITNTATTEETAQPTETPETPADTGGTPPPDTGGTPPPDTGGTPPPDTGGTLPPDTGGTPPPDTGGTPPPSEPEPCQVDCQGPPLGHLQGYAGGLYTQTLNDEGDPPVGVLANWNSKHVDFDFTNTEQSENSEFSALFQLRVGQPGQTEDQGGANFKFGAPDFDGTDVTFVNGGEFAGFTTNVEILHDDETPADIVYTPVAALASSGFDLNDIHSGSDIPDSISGDLVLPDFCVDCDFLKWGIFGAVASFEDDPELDEGPVQTVAVLGWWAAGDIPPVGQLPFTGTATYSGDAVATVATNLFSDGYGDYTQNLTNYSPTNGWTAYVATGDMNMDWNFGTRSGNLTISKFDASHFPDNGGLSFTGSMCAPGVTSCGGTPTPGGNHFGGALSGQLPAGWQNGQSVGTVPTDARDLSGFALGSFARGPDNIGRSIPQGVIGNWGVGNDNYMASGIFAGAHVVAPTQ